MFATLKCISSHLVWLKKINQIQIIVLKLIPRLVSSLSTNIPCPALPFYVSVKSDSTFFRIVLLFVFYSPSSARKFSVKYCHKSKQVLASSVMNTTFNFLSEKGLCPATETDRKCKSVKYIFSSIWKKIFYLLERKIFSLTRSFHGHLGRLGTTSL